MYSSLGYLSNQLTPKTIQPIRYNIPTKQRKNNLLVAGIYHWTQIFRSWVWVKVQVMHAWKHRAISLIILIEKPCKFNFASTKNRPFREELVLLRDLKDNNMSRMLVVYRNTKRSIDTCNYADHPSNEGGLFVLATYFGPDVHNYNAKWYWSSEKTQNNQGLSCCHPCWK